MWRYGMNQILLNLLVCPATRTQLTYDAVNKELKSEAAQIAYPIDKGVPVLIISEARFLEDVKEMAQSR